MDLHIFQGVGLTPAGGYLGCFQPLHSTSHAALTPGSFQVLPRGGRAQKGSLEGALSSEDTPGVLSLPRVRGKGPSLATKAIDVPQALI